MSQAEWQRLEENAKRTKHWRRWGPYISERQWGTVREDYSAKGDPWAYLTHDMAPAYTYRWGEDGIAGWSDNHQRLCFAISLWNGQDPILKERLFGLANPQGNHGEDVKECYWHLDATPTHSYMRYLYRYPQQAFPYQVLRDASATRSRQEPEFELYDTGIFDENRFFDVTVEYAKADAQDIVVRITIENAGPESAPIWLLPTFWFRNDWTWEGKPPASSLRQTEDLVAAEHPTLGTYYITADNPERWLFTENETNVQRLYGAENNQPFVKDAFHRYLVEGDETAVKQEATGTKCAALYRYDIEPGGKRYARLRFCDKRQSAVADGKTVDFAMNVRRTEADAFYEGLLPDDMTTSHKRIARYALAGMLWSRQWYHLVMERWLAGDPALPPPDPERAENLRNSRWRHVYNDDILSVPDKWEFPWYAVWDSAFHAVPLALVDPAFAKHQLTVFTREWYMHSNGQLPAYEWDFNDVNPPVHAWATWRVYEMERDRTGTEDTAFLESVYHKMLMYFTWWVNRKDDDGDNVFEGGFLGMDNIGIFDRSGPPPVGGRLQQSDATSWVAMFCLNMLRIAWELAQKDRAYEDIASKFFEHFLYIADAIHNVRGTGHSLWDEQDGFFYDQLLKPDGTLEPLRIRSMVGLIPLLAVEILDHAEMKNTPGFKRRTDWFFDNRPDLTGNTMCVFEPGKAGRCLLSLVSQEQLTRLLAVMLDENEFLSPYGIRSLSKVHAGAPYVFEQEDFRSCIGYEPGESESGLFGGNSNWRGPVWFPVNFLIIDALRRYHTFYGDGLTVEFPTGSGNQIHLGAVADGLAARLIALFEGCDGHRPVYGDNAMLQNDPRWRDLLWFHEYFHGDTGQGLGASHQTGWTGLVAALLLERAPGKER